MYQNVPARFLPDDPPEQIFPVEELDYAYNNDDLNATYELLERGIEEEGWGNRVGVISLDTDEELTYAAIREWVDRFAGALSDLGVDQGDRVFWRFSDRPEAIVTQFAVWKIGAVNVPSVPQERAREIEFYLNDTEASVVVTESDLLDAVETALPETPSVEDIIVVDASTNDYHEFEALVETNDGYGDHHPTAPSDVSSILYTGGTTGRPKGSIHSHVAEVGITDLEAGVGRALDPMDVIFAPPPIGHALGNGEKVNFPFRFGARTVLSTRPSPTEMLEIIEDHGVTIFAGAPTMLRMMLGRADISSYDVSSLRLMVIGGEMFDEETFQRWTEATGVEPCNTVGMTPFRHWFLTPYEAGEKREMTSPLAVGKLRRGYEGKVVDIDDPEQPVGRDEVGRLAVRGPTNITYWNNIHPDMPEKMAEDSIDGWGLTDDAYRRDTDGFFHFVTRLDNMIVTGGRQIAAPDVEEVLNNHPAVDESAVVGKPDEVRGQIVKAFVVTADETADADLVAELQDYCKEKMATFKYPREIEFLNELPKDDVGKIQRAELREREA